MSMIPNCRENEFYNQKYLNRMDAEYVSGYDYCADMVCSFFDNIDIYEGALDLDTNCINIIRFMLNVPEASAKLSECMQDWIELERNELITNIVDNMSDDEYEQSKKDVDSGARKPYLNPMPAEN